MASQSLYRKWRSQTFNDLVGQEPIIRTLKNALNSGNLAHAYLFTGPRGTGKTSTARLLAKTINCLNPRDGEPCNECSQCREITAGNSFNVIEIDAASNRGIDSIRDLREKVMMPPSTGKYKVYVLDEAHMLTTEAFNALLKTLEEPPGYAVFVLATTEVHKMLPTVLSRCQRFDFKRITTRQIIQHLNFVSGEEHVKLEAGAAELLARAAAGGMRDALSLLDQAIAYAGSEIALAQVQAMLGVADPRAIQKFISHVAQLDTSGGLRLIHELSEAGADLRQINAQIVEYWRALMLARAGADVATILDRTEDEVREILQAVEPFALEELTECARVFAQNDLIQKGQGTPQLAIELAFLECVELHRRAQSGSPLSASTTSSVQSHSPHPTSLAQPVATQSARSQPQHQPVSRPAQILTMPPSTPRSQPVQAPRALEAQTEHEYEVDDPPAALHQEPQPAMQATPPTAVSSPASGQPPDMLVESEMADQPEPAEGNQPGLTLQEVQERWETIKQRVKQKNRQTAALLSYYSVAGVEGTTEEAVVLIEAATEVFFNHLNQGERVKHVDWGLSMEFQQKCRVRLLHPGEQPPPSPTSSTPSVPPTPPVPSVPPSSPKSSRRPVNHGNTSDGHGAVSTAPGQPQAQSQSMSVEAPATKQKPVVQGGTNGQQKPTSSSPTPISDGQAHQVQAVPLARKNVVRENSNRVSVAAAQEMLEEKAKNNPVVQEVMRTFTVTNVQVNPK